MVEHGDHIPPTSLASIIAFPSVLLKADTVVQAIDAAEVKADFG
jgi:hypothetical protein